MHAQRYVVGFHWLAQTLAQAADFDAEHGPKLAQALAQAGTRAEPGNSHEILLSVRQGIGGRSALLYKVRADLRRAALSPTAPEFPLRHGLLPVRQPGTFNTPAESFFPVAHLQLSCANCSRSAPRLALARDLHSHYSGTLEATSCSGRNGSSRIAPHCSLVLVGHAPALVAEDCRSQVPPKGTTL